MRVVDSTVPGRGGEATTLAVTVVVCAYTQRRLEQTRAALQSALSQRPRPAQVLLVVDHNPALADRARRELPTVTVLDSEGEPGLSNARNTGLAAASQPVTVFLDDDAEARPGWLAALVEPYQRPEVVATGGSVYPRWPVARPRWLPPTFDWVVGCSYEGLPQQTGVVRNPIGANMSVRTNLARAVGGFDAGVGRVGSRPRGCEETELAIRLTASQPGSQVCYVPAAAVDHCVAAERLTARYFLSRCWHEGMSKAEVVRLVGATDGLAQERRHAGKVIPAALLRDLRASAAGDVTGLVRMVALTGGLVVTASGYLAGRSVAGDGAHRRGAGIGMSDRRHGGTRHTGRQGGEPCGESRLPVVRLRSGAACGRGVPHGVRVRRRPRRWRRGQGARGDGVVSRSLLAGHTFGLGDRALSVLRNPLYRSGYALVVNTVATTAVGFAYWMVAARFFSQQAVGQASALVSALILVSSFAQLNLANTLPRFLPATGRRAGRFIGYSYATASATALAAGAGFVLIMPRLSTQWAFLGDSTVLSVALVAAAVVWGVFALQDAALLGLQQPVMVPFENTVYGAAKLALVVALGAAALMPVTGLFLSWVFPLAVIVPAINWLIFRRYLPRRASATQVATVRPREVIRFAGVDYVGSIVGQTYTNMLPPLVLSVLGAAANASFYVAFTIASGLNLVSANFATSLLVEGSVSRDNVAKLTRGLLARSLLVTVAGLAVLGLGGRLVLGIYGHGYAATASLVLTLLAAGTIPQGLLALTYSLDRLAGHVGRAGVSRTALAIMVLGGSWALLGRIGVDGVGVAWFGGSCLVAAARLPTLIKAVRQGAPVRASTDPAPRPDDVLTLTLPLVRPEAVEACLGIARPDEEITQILPRVRAEARETCRGVGNPDEEITLVLPWVRLDGADQHGGGRRSEGRRGWTGKGGHRR